MASQSPPAVDGAQYALDDLTTPRSPIRSGSSTPLHLEDARLLPSSPVHRSATASSSGFTGTPSPLNPSQLQSHTPSASAFSTSSSTTPFARHFSLSGPSSSPNSRPDSRTSTARYPSDDVMAGLGLGANASGFPPSIGPRGSMILYRLADEHDHEAQTKAGLLLPPKLFSANNRDSVVSSSASSIISFSSDSKYPTAPPSVPGSSTLRAAGALIPYAYDPASDMSTPMDDEDRLHDPTVKGGYRGEKGHFPWRGLVNVGVLILLVLGLICLFAFYPILTFYRDQARFRAIEGNIRINATGQNPELFQMPEAVDTETPQDARSRTGFDGQEYELVFSDEFNQDGRSFYPGDDPFWEAVDLWYGATGDVEWYDPQQVTTRDGALVITMDSVNTLTSGVTPGSTAPFTAAENHGLDYRSGMLQSWNKFCFTTGYVEVSVTFPGPDQNTQGYWPGAWTMGNLARPGYAATTDGMWPYTYDSCDVGTFPNQTNPDGLGPAAALHSDASRSRYNMELSWLSGQRLSACSCPGSDHPGPSPSVGRGAPEIDIFEAEKDKDFTVGHVVSQSAQFAPFTHDYTYNNDSGQWTNFDPSRTRANTYRGSAVQQSVSGLTRTPSDMFQGVSGGPNFKTFGFEYWSDPQDREAGYINWQVDGQPSHRVLAAAVGPDQGEGGSGVGQRLIPEEPLALIMNLGMSPNWQTIDLSTMMFPAEFKIDYIRVYQRKGQTNTGCSPKNYPTKTYIDNHLEAYTDVNMTTWDWPKPKNSLYSGGC